MPNGRSPRGICINKDNNIYIGDRTNNNIKIWSDGQFNPTKIISSDLNSSHTLFVTISDDIHDSELLLIL
jgi:hypothetical protein